MMITTKSTKLTKSGASPGFCFVPFVNFVVKI